MNIKIIKEKINREKLEEIAKENYGDMVKAVVDIKRRVIAIGGELHADANELLIKDGSNQEDVWGINIYPDNPAEKRIVFSSLINIRPLQNNRSLDVEDKKIRTRIKEVINKLIELNG